MLDGDADSGNANRGQAVDFQIRIGDGAHENEGKNGHKDRGRVFGETMHTLLSNHVDLVTNRLLIRSESRHVSQFAVVVFGGRFDMLQNAMRPGAIG